MDDVGFYVVIKMRDDIEKAKEISRGIRKGTLRSFSIGGQAISKKQKNNSEFGQYNEIDKLELHEVTICEKGINPEAKFDILKMEDKKMSDKLEKALGELNDLVAQIGGIDKEDNIRKEAEYMDTDEEMDDMDMDDEQVEVEEDMVQDALRGLKDVQALLDALGGAEMDMDDAPADDMPMADAPEEDEKELMEDDVIEESEIDLALEGVSYEASKDEIISEVAKRVARRIAEAKKAKAKYDRAIGNSRKK